MLIPVFLSLVALPGCETQEGSSGLIQPSADEIALMDSIETALVSIDSLNKLSEGDLIHLANEQYQHEDYGNHTFNNSLRQVGFRYGWGSRLVASTPLFSEANDTSEHMAQLYLNTELKVLAQQGDWKEVVCKGKTGFVPNRAVCEQHIPYDDEGIDFLIYTSKFHEGGWPQMVTMMAVDRIENKVLGSLEVPFRVKEYWASRSTSALKNAEYILTLNFTRSSCPGHTENYHYAYKDGEFTEVSHSFGMGEVGYFSYNTVYLPVRFENNHILHLANANTQYAFNWSNGKLESLLVPDSIDIPLDELVVIKSAQGEPEFDKNGNSIFDENGNEIIKDLGSAVHYYRWNGATLELYKSTNPDFMAGMI